MRVKYGVLAVGVGAMLAVSAAGADKAPKKKDKGPQPKIAKPVGVTKLATVHPEAGFVEDAFAFDGSGGRLVLVRADADTLAEVEIIDVANAGQSVARFDVSATTTWITQVEIVLDGSAVLIIGKTPDELRAIAAVYDLTGKKLREIGPAGEVAVAEINGKPAVVLYDQLTREDGVTHEVAVFNLADGKPLTKKKTFVADAQGFIKAIDMRLLYWRNGYTQLVGLRKGEYDKVKDQRLNDSEGIYDVVEGRVVRNTVIQDLVLYTSLIKLRLAFPNKAQFLALRNDGDGLELVTADDKRINVDTKELSFDHYDPGSFQWQQGRDGRIWFSLTIDPVNPEAVNNKKADPEHVDLFVVDKTGQAKRVARIAKAQRSFVWAVGAGTWAVLRKHKGYGRGGPDLEIFTLTNL